MLFARGKWANSCRRIIIDRKQTPDYPNEWLRADCRPTDRYIGDDRV